MPGKRGQRLAHYVAELLVCVQFDGIKQIGDRATGLAAEMLREKLPKYSHAKFLDAIENLFWETKKRYPREMFDGEHRSTSDIVEWIQLGSAARLLETALADVLHQLRPLGPKDADKTYFERYESAGRALRSASRHFNSAADRLMDEIGKDAH